MVLPAPLRDEQHGQHDQRDFAEQAGIAAVADLGPAEERQQADQSDGQGLDQVARPLPEARRPGSRRDEGRSGSSPA